MPDSGPAPGAHAFFPRFADLPAELRLAIWSCLIQPRVVLAACMDAAHAAQKRAEMAARPRRRPTPVLLHVNRETRALALHHYELTFAWRMPLVLSAAGGGGGGGGEKPPPSGPARVWFNFALDALLLLGELEPTDADGVSAPMVHFLRREDTLRVRHVAAALGELLLLRHGEAAAEERVFGCLFHVLDRFASARRLLATSVPPHREWWGPWRWLRSGSLVAVDPGAGRSSRRRWPRGASG